MSTMRDVALRSGVSAKTVSRVMRGEGYVSDTVRERVLAAVEDLNYVPNMLAVTFRLGKDAAIGVAVPDIGDPFFAQIVQAIEATARARDTAVIVTSLGYDGDHEQAAVEALLRRQVQGLIACPIASDQSYLKPWMQRTPTVFVDRSPHKVSGDIVIEDDFGGAAIATAHLIGHGHRRIAFVGDSSGTSTTQQRFQGYVQALADAGIQPDDDLVHLASIHERSMPGAVRAFVEKADPATAIFSSNARCTLEVVPALQSLHPGLDSPALVSFGDFPMAAALTPSVTVIDQSPGRLGAFAAERLFRRIEDPGKRLRRRTVLPVSLIERESCRLLVRI